ncbi:MAG: hypothetical protein OXI01_24705, partial [Albidovulum sp.]|nr:hypothetical protein [Albidovulum sp.]
LKRRSVSKACGETGPIYSSEVAPRAGGTYFGTVSVLGRALCCDREKLWLTNWLIEQRRLGVACPKITDNIIDRVGSKGWQDRAMSRCADNKSKNFVENSDKLGIEMHLETADQCPELFALSGLLQVGELDCLARYLESRQFRAAFFSLINESELLDWTTNAKFVSASPLQSKAGAGLSHKGAVRIRPIGLR